MERAGDGRSGVDPSGPIAAAPPTWRKRLSLNELLELAADPSTWAALGTLIAMEVVLGIDNLVFVAVLSNKIAAARRAQVRRVGMSFALLFRLALLGSIAALVRLTAPLFVIAGHGFSARDLILLAGGIFLVWKATREIHDNVNARPESHRGGGGSSLGVASAIGQIIVLDLVFSIDSIVTAVGMTDHIAIMVVAVIAAVTLMIWAADRLAAFINRNPTIVVLALSFLLMIGMTLMADGFGVHVPKGYIYAAMLFSAGVETLNTIARNRRRREPK
jgi:predicted tellurium resistance membrane protein TerC